MEKTCEPNKKELLTKAQVNRNYIDKLKKMKKYDEYKAKMALIMKKRRTEKKEKEALLPKEVRDDLIEKRRQASRERVRKYREKQKTVATQFNNSIGGFNASYKNLSTLCKATKKVTRALPVSPRKQKAVLSKILNDMDASDRNELISTINLPSKKKVFVPNHELINDIKQFLERDDISYTSPRAKDVKKYPCPKTGANIMLPTRYMVLTMKETHALFIEMQQSNQRHSCSLSFFCAQRPQNIKLIHDLPHDMCMCSYHANFIESVSGLRKVVPNLPAYKEGFVQRFLCKDATRDCWFGYCIHCKGITTNSLNREIGTVPLDSNTSWLVWKKNSDKKRIEKKEETGTLSKLVEHIVALSPLFLRHSFIKTAQSDTFNLYDRVRACDSQFGEEGMLQLDFAENFVCEAQDEVQSAHWNQRQLSLFTTALHYNDTFQSKILVSDSLVHTKETIVPYMYKLLENLRNSLKVLKIWSDGPSSQFKNKYIAAIIAEFEKKFDLKIYWNYFATSHGKGCVDGIGATAKLTVRKHVRARESIVNCAADFVKAFNRTPSHIIIEEVSHTEIDKINNLLNTANIFENVRNVRDIAKAHQIQIVDSKIVTYHTSKDGYN